MPDTSDVENALVATIRAAVSGQTYAGTKPQTGPAASWTVGVLRGWPEAARLTGDSAANIATVRVFPRPNMSRDDTRYPTDWFAITPATPSLTVSVSGQTATFGGTASVGQAAAILNGSTVYAYRVVAGDTPSTIAGILGPQIDGARVSGPTVTAPLLRGAQTGMDSLATREVARQQQHYMVSVWCSDPKVRDAASSAIDAAIRSLSDANGNIRAFLPVAWASLTDPVQCPIIYQGTNAFDRAQDANVYRRDLYYRVEYPTLQTQTQPVMLFGGLILHRGFQEYMILPGGAQIVDGSGVPLQATGDDYVAQGLVDLAVDDQPVTFEDGTPITLPANAG